MANQDLIVKMISDLKTDFKSNLQDLKKENSNAHKGIANRLDTLNGNVACIKRKQFRLRYILMGVAGTLAILGLIPDRLWDLLKSIFI